MDFRKIVLAFNGVFEPQHRHWAKYTLITNETLDLREVMYGDEL
jgi:hypothetical protein